MRTSLRLGHRLSPSRECIDRCRLSLVHDVGLQVAMPETDKPQGPYPPSAITIAGLRIFESVARHASFSRAAEELQVSQPYVSNQVHELEVKLRVALFRRVGRRVYLTESG